MSRVVLPVVTLLVLLLLPASARAAEGFAGVLEDGRLVRFTSQSPYSLSTPRVPTGLAPGERLLALGTGPQGVVAVGSSARLYAVDVRDGRARPVGPPFEQGLRGSRFSLATAPGATSGRLISDVGQDLVLDLTTGAARSGPGLRRSGDGATLRPAVDVAPDGRLVGAQLGPATFLRESQPGSSAMDASALALPREPRFAEPIGFQVGADGRGHLLGVLAETRSRQSLLASVDLATGTLTGGSRPRISYFGRRLTSFVALGRVAEDRVRPRATVRLARTLSVRALIARGLPLAVTTDEAAQVTASLRVGARIAGFGFRTRDTPGTVDLRKSIFFGAADRAALRRAVGRRVRVRIGVNDLKRNVRRLERVVRLTR